MATDRYDVVVIGAGPAGYVAAIRCAQLGLRTACVDRWLDDANKPSLGGTCLNVGCIPSKTLLEASELFVEATHGAAYGIRAQGITLDLPAMMQHKGKVVGELTGGVAQLFRAHGIEWIQGRGKLLPNRRVEVVEHGGATRVLEAQHVILATGSTPVELGMAPLAADRIVDSAGALSFKKVPPRLGIIGAGVIGLELGSVWQRLGSKVILLEAQERFLSMADAQIARDALKQFNAQGLDIRLGARVLRTAVTDKGVNIDYEDKNGAQQITCDQLIVAVGRRPCTDGLFAPETELLLDDWGFVHVDDHCLTNLPGVHAVGDVVRGPMLAHKGMEEGVMVAEIIAGQHAEVNYDVVPSVIYTSPEIAWAGKTEEALKAASVEYRSGVFPFAANGRAKALGTAIGFIKILSDARTDRVLGVHMLGPQCAELIALGVMAMEFGASSEDIALTMFAHPSLSESFHEAALSVLGRPLHIARSPRPPSAAAKA
ncbi:MAG: dihydrolipoyl dehydrogenase [Candidatus Muproteobacteria bacterium RBG_16_60_9]|uniref:Dihydrolipoyl dehydrogenase n=1 Tax=Candidatus Muproteobacteria bacterium RBG_16_60_9 TaxID=1817755 RepID=A0A1F6UVV5_9PROT|nr:MAG: dihydrolipoyl dehydrogenase [Candidatus Muproteobacteria bacterium RBG_16_60_9]